MTLIAAPSGSSGCMFARPWQVGKGMDEFRRCGWTFTWVAVQQLGCSFHGPRELRRVDLVHRGGRLSHSLPSSGLDFPGLASGVEKESG